MFNKKLFAILGGVLLAVTLNVFASQSYGPIKRGDSLWSIAAKMRPSKSVSINDMVDAIKKMNPGFFSDGHTVLNIGDILTIPSSSQEVYSALGNSKFKPVVYKVPKQTKSVQTKPVAHAKPVAKTPVKKYAKEPSFVTKEQPVNKDQLKMKVGQLKQMNDIAQQSQAKTTENLTKMQVELQKANQTISDLKNKMDNSPTIEKSSSGWAWFWFIVLLLIVIAVIYFKRDSIRSFSNDRKIIARRFGLGSNSPKRRNIRRYKTMELRSIGGYRKTKKSRESGAGQKNNTGSVLADVMIAMADNNYSDAEKLLRDAIRKNKNDIALRMKLLELYVAMDNREDFKRESDYLCDNLISEGDDTWNEIRSMYFAKWAYD